MKRFLIISSMFFATALSAQTVELMKTLGDLIAERSNIELEQERFKLPYFYPSGLGVFADEYFAPLSDSDLNEYNVTNQIYTEKLKVNTLRLEETVQELEQYELSLSTENQEKLYDAKIELYNDWLEDNKLDTYDTRGLKNLLVKYLNKKIALLERLDSMVDEALILIADKIKCNLPFTPEEVVIEAKIFPYLVGSLKNVKGLDRQSLVFTAVTIQASLLTNLKTAANEGV
ncbi:MAG: hypothetical protein WCQ53_06675, partial [bacterium]